MSAAVRLRRLGSGILLAAVFASAGGFHHHERLSAFVGPAGPGSPEHVVSSHSPLSKASHWHSIVRTADDTCLACHAHRFAAVAGPTHGPAPADVGLFVSHRAPQRAVHLFCFGDPTRGPPALS